MIGKFLFKERIFAKRPLTRNVSYMRARVPTLRKQFTRPEHTLFKIGTVMTVIGVKILLVYHNRHKAAAVRIIRSKIDLFHNVLKRTDVEHTVNAPEYHIL